MTRARWVLALAVVSCGGHAMHDTQPRSNPATPASTSATPPSASSAEPVASAPPPTTSNAPAPPPVLPPVPAGPGVTLLDPGAEPRTLLRYAFGMRAESMQVDLKVAISMNATPLGTTPTIRMVLDIAPIAVDRQGTLTAAYVVRRANLLSDVPMTPAELKHMSDDLKSFVQARGRYVVTSSGAVRELTFEPTANVPQSMQSFAEAIKEAMRNASSRLPEVPVGVGARWEVHETIATRAFGVEQASTHTLVDRTANGAEQDVSVTRTAPPQPMNLPAGALHPGTNVNLVSHASHGTTHAKIVLDHVVPTSRVHLESQTKMVISVGTTKQPEDMAVTFDTRLEPIP